MFQTRAAMLAGLLEETLEFGGTLLIGLSAGLALRRSSRQAHGRQAQYEGCGAAAGVFSGRRLMRLAVGSMAAVGVLAVVYRGPLADARARTHVGAFHVDLRDSVVEEHSLVQELGFVPLSKTGAELLFEVFSQRCERGSILVTTNLPFDEWTEVLSSERLTGALLDRLTQHVHILEMNGQSYRLEQSRQATTLLSAGSPADP